MSAVTLPIHFGNSQGKHEISADTLLVVIESYKEIAEYFGARASINVGLPEEGGWKTNFFIVVSVLGINPITALMTGNTADEWAKIGHERIIEKINDFITTEADKLSDEIPRGCIKNKNKIYQQLQNDDCIDSFRLGDIPPISRRRFHLYIKEVQDEEHVYLGETNITVHSPDWKGKRSWRGKIEIVEDRESAFAFDKDLTGKFWEKVRLDALPLHTTDVMKVQLVQRPTNKVKYLAVRVLSYNDELIDSQITEADIERMYGSLGDVGERPSQYELFPHKDEK